MTDGEKPRGPRKPVKTGRKQAASRFKPGTSGNPAGRPRGSRSLATKLLDEIGAEAAGAILSGVIRRARRGDIVAAQLVLSRCWPIPRGRALRVKLPPIANATDAAKATAEVIGAVSRGEITPDEARAVADLLGRFVEAIEISDLERRLAALEASSAPPPEDRNAED